MKEVLALDYLTDEANLESDLADLINFCNGFQFNGFQYNDFQYNDEDRLPTLEIGGSGYDSNDNKGFSSGTADYGQKPYFSTQSVPSAYGYGGPGKKIDIPNGRVGVIIGKGGETIKYLQLQSGAKIQVTRDMDADPHSLTRAVEITGTSEAIAKAEQLIIEVLAEAKSGGSGIVSRRLPAQQGGTEQFVMQVPNNKVGLIIGKGGETIKSMQASSGARIQGFCHPQIASTFLPADQTPTSSQKTIMLKSSDGETFEVEEAVALKSQTIKHMIEDECADTSIPLHHVDSKTLSKVIEYCKKHVESTKNKDKTAEEDLKTFDSEFAEAAKGSLFDLIKAADYLNIKSLLHLTCQAVADMAEDIRRACNIVTALEEEACMKKPCDYLV